MQPTPLPHFIPALFRRPLLWWLLGAAVLLTAVLAVRDTPLEVLPQFSYPQISVTVHAAGATATMLEREIVTPIEGQILALPGVQSVHSVMGNGTVEIDVRFVRGASAERDLQAVWGGIDRVRATLPAGVNPVVQVMGNAINEVLDLSVALPPEVSPAAVERVLAAEVAPAIRAVPGVQTVSVYGNGQEAMRIEPNLAAMRHAGVSLATMMRAVRASVVQGSAGYLQLGHNDVLIEVRHWPKQTVDWANIPLPTNQGAGQGAGQGGGQGTVPLSAVARIERAALPVHHAILLDGAPSVALTVFKQPGASTQAVTEQVQALLARMQPMLPAGAHWVTVYNQGRLVGRMGADLGRDLALGALLAMAVLFWLLGAGRGVVVLALTIPASILLAVAVLHALGQDLNLMTLGALSVAVGLLADDAILVLESIYRQWEARPDGGLSPQEGILAGLRLIALPALTGTLANLAIYAPLLFVGGLVGLFFIPFSLAMLAALSVSLVLSLTFVPFLLSQVRATAGQGGRSGQRFLAALYRLNSRLFERVLRAPRLSLALTVALLIGSLAGLAWVPMNFLPLPNEGVLLESFTLPPGTALRDTEQVVQRISQRVQQDPAVAHVYARIGSAAGTAYTEPAYAGEIQVVLHAGVKARALDAIGARIQQESSLPGVQLAVDTPTVERVGESLSGLPQPFVLHVFGPNIAALRQATEQITARLRTVPGLSDVFNNDGYPITQIQLRPKPMALIASGMTPQSLLTAVRPLLAGTVLTTVPDGNPPLPIFLRLAAPERLSLSELAALRIETPQGLRPLGQLAAIDLVTEPNSLRHIAGARALDILATPTAPLDTVERAAHQALAGMILPPGVRVEFGGLAVALEQAALGLLLAVLVACGLMLGILLLQFDGWLVPGLLLLEIPLALTGGAVALLVSGLGLNATGMIGFLTLIGIGLRHSIVLLDRAQQNERQGMSVEAAVRDAIALRFRPIVLTALVAMIGMLPTAFGWGEGAAPEQGLAVVLLGGLAFSAIRSTNLIPALYLRARQRAQSRTESHTETRAANR